MLRLHRCHVEAVPDDVLEVHPIDLRTASERELEQLGRLASEVDAASLAVTVHIDGGKLHLTTSAKNDFAESLACIPLPLANAFPIGEVGVLVVPNDPEGSSDSSFPQYESEGQSRGLDGDESISDPQRPTRAWLLVLESKVAVPQAIAEFAKNGALRSDFEEEYSFDSLNLGSGASATVRRAWPRRGAGSVGSFGSAPGALAPAPPVAVKCYKPDTPLSVMHEVSMLVAVQSHPSIMAFHGAFALQNKDPSQLPTCIVAMELCPRSLWAEVSCFGGLTELRSKSIAWAVLGGLRHMHSRNIIHRDIKPENIMIHKDNSAVIADFGLACLASDEEQVMKRCGSPGYVAPEILRKQGASFKTDIFSFGSTLFVTIGGRHPFRGSSIEETLRLTKVCSVEFRGERFNEASGEAKRVIRNMLCGIVEMRPDAAKTMEYPWFGHFHQEESTRALRSGSKNISEVATEDCSTLFDSGRSGTSGGLLTPSAKRLFRSGMLMRHAASLPCRASTSAAAAARADAAWKPPESDQDDDDDDGDDVMVSTASRRQAPKRPWLRSVRLPNLLTRATTAASSAASRAVGRAAPEDRAAASASEADDGFSTVAPSSRTASKGSAVSLTGRRRRPAPDALFSSAVTVSRSSSKGAPPGEGGSGSSDEASPSGGVAQTPTPKRISPLARFGLGATSGRWRQVVPVQGNNAD